MLKLQPETPATTPTPSPALLGPGSVVHNWKIERLLAKGGMGSVFFAKHKLVGRSAAIKVIAPPAGTVADPKAMARFHTEVELHVSLRLPNLPEFFDAELMPDGTAVLILEYLDGRDLADTLKFLGRLPVGDALFVVTEILRPLQVVHARSVHRDIKPSNIFIRRRPRFDSEGKLEKGRVTLLDFGIAKMNLKPGVTREHSILGTKCYMSPEQLRGEPLDGRSDLFAVGVVLYEMLAGHPPYVSDLSKVPSFPEIMIKTLSEPPADLRKTLPDLPEDVWELVSVLLAKEPGDRYASAEAALSVARTLRARYRTSAKLFTEEVDDVLDAMEALKAEGWGGAPGLSLVTNPMATDESAADAFASTEETAAHPAEQASLEPPAWPPKSGPQPVVRTPLNGVTADEEVARSPIVDVQAATPEPMTPQPVPTKSGRPAERTTALLSRSNEANQEVEDWKERQLRHVRERLRAPRIFRRPAFVELAEGGRLVAMYELKHAATIIGSGKDAGIPVPGALPLHAVARRRRDGQLELELTEQAMSRPESLAFDGRVAPSAALVHGTLVRVASTQFKVIDLTVADPSGQRVTVRKRAKPARVTHLTRSDKAERRSESLTMPLLLIGSSAVCDLQVPTAPAVCAAVWLRGDGELELVEIDMSVLPYGQPIGRCRLVSHGDAHALNDNDIIVVHDPSADSLLETKPPAEALALSPPAPRARLMTAPTMVAVDAGELSRKKPQLVVVAKAQDGFKRVLELSFELPECTAVLGRGPASHILVDHPSVRDRHATLRLLEDGRLRVDEQGSGRLQVGNSLSPLVTLEDGEGFTIPGIVSFEYRKAVPKTGLFSSLFRKLGFGVLLISSLSRGEVVGAEKNVSSAAPSSAPGSSSV